MPGNVGGRSMPDELSPGAGSSSSMCAISPSDEVGIVGNLIDRIKALETAVSQLLAVNVMANQLSDISQQIGWVYNITYMGQPGWTQTEAGTLIPPKGVSLSSLGLLMSDGNPFPFVSMDSDGVLQFGFDSDGLTSGAKSDYWDAGGAAAPIAAMDYGAAWYNSSGGGTTGNSVRNMIVSSVNSTQIELQAAQAGLYAVHAHIDVSRSGAVPDCVLAINQSSSLATSSRGLYTRSSGPNDTSGGMYSLAISGEVSLSASEVVKAYRSGFGLTTHQFHLHAVRLSG